MKNLSNFPERLKELIFDAQTNATQLSLILKCGNATIHHYTTGRYLPTTEMTVKLADYFQCTTDFLLGIDTENYACNFNACPPFRERLAQICKYYEITRYQLQKLTGIPESVLRYWARGKTKPSIDNIVKIADALNCSVDFVLGREK